MLFPKILQIDRYVSDPGAKYNVANLYDVVISDDSTTLKVVLDPALNTAVERLKVLEGYTCLAVC